MTILATFGDLKGQVASTLSRADLASGGANAARVPEFIYLAEKRINRSLARIGAGELRSTSLATTSNVETVDLPTDFNASRALSLTDGSRIYDVTFMPPEELDREFPTTAQDRPVGFTVLGKDGVSDTMQAWFRPIPDAAYNLRLTYYKLLTTLTSGADSGVNWFLTNYPDAYLYATCIEAAIWMQDDAAVQKWITAYQVAEGDIKTMDHRRRYTGGQLQRASSVRLLRRM